MCLDERYMCGYIIWVIDYAFHLCSCMLHVCYIYRLSDERLKCVCMYVCMCLCLYVRFLCPFFMFVCSFYISYFIFPTLHICMSILRPSRAWVRGVCEGVVTHCKLLQVRSWSLTLPLRITLGPYLNPIPHT